MRRPPRAQSCLGFVRGAPAVCGRRARSISPLSLPCERLPRCACCRVRGPRRVRGAALRPGGLLLLCSACTRTESRSSRAALTTPRFLVGKNASAKENFGERRRRPPPGTAGERSEGSDERSLVRPVRRAHGSAAAKPTAGRARTAHPPSQRSRDGARVTRRRALHCCGQWRRGELEQQPHTINGQPQRP